MSGKPQEPEQNDWESQGGSLAPAPTQKTSKGLEISVPTRGSIFAAFKKIVGKPQKGR